MHVIYPRLDLRVPSPAPATTGIQPHPIRCVATLTVCLLAILFTATSRLNAQNPPLTPEQKADIQKNKKQLDAEIKAENASHDSEQEKYVADSRLNGVSSQEFCPANQRPTISDLPGSFFRPSAKKDYVVLELNADPHSLQTRWYDYQQAWYEPSQKYPIPHPIQRNGSFLPVVYTKEKILVHVCNLHFTDILTVSISGAGLPENGGDFRGATPTTTVPTISAALDSLQSVGITGQASALGGIGFAATPALSSVAVSGIAPGTISNGSSGLSYSDTNITASPEELASLMYAAFQNALQLTTTIKTAYSVDPSVSPALEAIANDRNNLVSAKAALSISANAMADIPTLKMRVHQDFADEINLLKSAPNQFNQIFKDALTHRDEVDQDRDSPDFKTNAPLFDRDMTNIQNLSSQMTTFFGVLAAQGFGARAVAIWNNYAILRGPLELIENHDYTSNCIPKDQATDAQLKLQAAEATDVAAHKATADANKTLDELIKAHKSPALIAAARQVVRTDELAEFNADKGLRDAANPPANPDGPVKSPLNCSDWEKANAVKFKQEYDKQLALLDSRGPTPYLSTKDWNPAQMFIALLAMQKSINQLVDVTREMYKTMNDWNDASSIEQTDFVTPATGNALERISIAVQHGYVPFTLTTNGTSTAPTLAAAVAPTVTTTASTSTPAHAVKTVLVEVHRRGNFNLEGAAMIIKVPTATYAVQASPTQATFASSLAPTSAGSANPTVALTSVSYSQSSGMYTYTYTYTYAFNQAFSGTCNNGASQPFANSVAYVSTTQAVYSATAVPTNPAPPAYAPAPANAPTPATTPAYSCIVTTQAAGHQLVGLAGVVWYPGGRDYFPRRNGFTPKPHDLLPGVYAGTSVTSLGNVFLGFNEEPVSGLSVLLGWGLANTTVLPSSITSTSVLPSGYTLQTTTQSHWKFAFGFGIDLGIFGSIFKGTGGATLP